MLPYLLLFLFSFSLLFLDNENSKPNYFWFYLFIVVATVFSGLRDMIGGYDIFIYGQVFEATVKQILNYGSFEIGYRLYNILLKFINNDRQFLFIATAFLICISHFHVLKKYSPFLYFSLFLLFCKFYILSFVYLRQFLAMGIIWLSIPCLLNKQYIRAGLLLLVSFFFHKSSIIFAPLIFVGLSRFKNFTLLTSIIIAIFIGVSPLSQFFIEILSENSNSSKLVTYAATNNALNIFYLLEILVLSFLILHFRTDFYRNTTGRILINGVFIYILLNTISLFNASFIRFGWYYYIFVILFISYIPLYLMDKVTKNLFKFIIILYFSSIFFRILYFWDGGDMMPYKTIYQDFYRPHLYDHFEYRPRKY